MNDDRDDVTTFFSLSTLIHTYDATSASRQPPIFLDTRDIL